MSESALARRYAKALFDLALEEERVEAIRGELENFGTLAKDNPNLMDVLSNRFLNADNRLAVIDQLGGRLELSKTVSNFLKLLVKKGRISFLKPMVAVFRRMAFDHQKTIEACVKSAFPLDSATTDAIAILLSRSTGKKIILEHVVDCNLLGGIWLKIGNEIYDGTVKADLNLLKNKMIHSLI